MSTISKLRDFYLSSIYLLCYYYVQGIVQFKIGDTRFHSGGLGPYGVLSTQESKIASIHCSEREPNILDETRDSKGLFQDLGTHS